MNNQRLERVVETLDRVNLRPAEVFLDKYPHQLSGGQLQRVVLARALVLHPDFLVADEPVSMLDVSVRAGILNTTRRLARELGLATVYISHDLSLLQYTCDRIAIMYLGENRRNRSHQRGYQQSAAPLYAGADRRRAGARSDCGEPATAHSGRCAAPD